MSWTCQISSTSHKKDVTYNIPRYQLDWLEILIVTLSSVATGIVVWYVTTSLSERRLQQQLKVNFSELSGHWESTHLSRDDSRGGVFISRHGYDLTVGSDGKIKGTYDELAETLRTNLNLMEL